MVIDKLSVIYRDFFWPISWWNLIAFCLSFPKWCNTYTFVEEIKALEYQTFSTHFLSKFMFFWITQKVTFFTHPNDFLGNNSNKPMGTTGFWYSSPINCPLTSIKYQLSLTSNTYLIKLSMQGVFWNRHDEQILKLTLGVKFDQDFT